MRTYKVLILEDDLKTLSFLLDRLAEFEEENIESFDIAVSIFSEYTHVENYINKLPRDTFDVILLDRDCKLCGSFHVLDIEKFGTDKVISISSTPQWNEEAGQRGIEKIVHKDYENLDQFADLVVEHIKLILNTPSQ
ncbi:MAG: hypothetical protein BWY19_01143 [bacterium ADurb.Bin212]|nr:MAG: hypothetical protein BWY19_01143 [bacterium ADurb.Bin212]